MSFTSNQNPVPDPSDYLAVDIEVPKNTADVYKYVAEELYRRLGLRSYAEAIACMTFYKTPYDPITDAANHLRARNAFAAEIAANKRRPFTAYMSVPVSLVIDVNRYLASIGRVGIFIIDDRINRFADAVERVVTDVGNTIVGAARDYAESAGDQLSGIGKMAEGRMQFGMNPVGSPAGMSGLNKISEGAGQYAGGLLKFNGTPVSQAWVDALLSMGGTLVGAGQTLLNMESLGRKLNGGERTLLESIFLKSVNYDSIRIKVGYAGIASAGEDNGFKLFSNNRAITHGNTIYMKNTPSLDWNHVLVHETTHVWQHQNGGTDYMAEALHAQSPLGGGYLFNDAVTVQNKTWAMLNPEQQGYLIQQAYIAGYFTTNAGQWIETDPITKKVLGSRPDLAKYMQSVMPQLHARQGAT